MPKISWLNLPLPVRQHLIDRMHDTGRPLV
jgi:hypothetical protein